MSAGVIVGYDGSECAKAALRAGADVAKAYGDKLIVAFGYELNPIAGEMRDYQLALRDLATKRLEDA
jgi:nucleotide-binding universal stress UspA family protein